MKRRKEFDGATWYNDRQGVRRWRFRRNGRSWELGTEYGSPEFVRRYEAALAELKGHKIGQSLVKPGTISDLLARYYVIALPRWSGSTAKTNRAILERFRDEHGHRPVAGVRSHNIDAILARMANRPAAAHNLRKRLIPVFRLAMKLGWLTVNPAELADPPPYVAKGHHTWTEDEIARYYAVHRLGTVAHTAMTLMLWTGAARVDAVKLGWFNIKDTPQGERLQYTRQKTGRMKSPVLISLPIAPDLSAVLDLLPTDAGTFLQTAEGKQRSAKAVTGAMREWCDAAGLPECTPHGLRKAIARRLGDEGASALMIGSVTGHKTLSEVQRYTEKADRQGLAARGMALISGTKPEENLTNDQGNSPNRAGKVLK